MRSVPSGTLIILWTTATVPTEYRSSQPGGSASVLRTVISASIRSPETTSSISLTERSWPTASGVIDSGKTTVSFSGRTGSRSRSGALGGLVRAHPFLRTTIATVRPRGAPLCDRQRDAEHPGLVRRGRRCGGDVVAERDQALEVPVLDLRLLVDLPADARAGAVAGDHQRLLVDHDLDRLGLDARELDQQIQLVRVVRDVAVDGRPEAVPQTGEAGNLPEVGEELFDLPLQAIDVSARHIAQTTRHRRIET